MKYLPILLILVLASPSIVAAQQTTPSDEAPSLYNHYYAPGQVKRVTVETANGLATVLEVPAGAFLNVQAREDQNPSVREAAKTPPREFRGELVLRIRRADEMEAGESGAADAIMAKAPVVMHLANAVVKVEKL